MKLKNKAGPNKVLALQASSKSQQLEEVEMDWMSTLEELEQMEQDMDSLWAQSTPPISLTLETTGGNLAFSITVCAV